MQLPDGMESEEFEGWYLDRHVDYAKASEGLLRYAIHRSLPDLPDLGAPSPYRVAQLWWADEEAIVSSFESYSGSASRGDTALNVTLDPDVHPSMCISSRRYEEVDRPLAFDIRRGQFVGCPDGSSYNLLAFGCTDGGLLSGDAQLSAALKILGEDQRVGECVLGTSIGRRLKIGLRSMLPGSAQTAWDWEFQLGARSHEEIRAVITSEAFESLWGLLSAASTDLSVTVTRSQELFVSYAPRH